MTNDTVDRADHHIARIAQHLDDAPWAESKDIEPAIAVLHHDARVLRDLLRGADTEAEALTRWADDLTTRVSAPLPYDDAEADHTARVNAQHYARAYAQTLNP